MSLDVPFPADYGGAIDILFRIQALHKLGFEITLHCFEYGRDWAQKALEAYTKELHYYPRKKPLTDWLSGTPFIVKTRSDNRLLENLLKDDSPILFEGLHTTFFLADERLKDRIKIVRAHNVEHEYYAELAKHASGTKRLFFASEARKLEKYEPVLKHASHILAIQQNDLEHFKTLNDSVHLLPACTPLSEAVYLDTDPYCLFQGNLSVPENENAANWILDALSDSKVNLRIAGKDPSEKLKARCRETSVKLIANPDEEAMQSLIQKARVHALYTDQPTGLKLKLLNALNTSGHVVANAKMVAGTVLDELCEIEDRSQKFKQIIERLMDSPLSEEAFSQRQNFLSEHFDSLKNCQLIVDLING